MKALPQGPIVQDILALRAALMVREHLGFRRASEVLGVNASVLSRRILTLEDALGVSLFQRTHRGARPTVAGERFLDEVEAALTLLSDAAARAGKAGRGSVGRLRLGHVWPVLAGPGGRLMRRYRSACCDVELDLRAGSAAQLVSAVFDRELDIALIDDDDAPTSLNRLPLWSEAWLIARPADAPEEALGRVPVLCAAGDNWRRIQRMVAERCDRPAVVRSQMTSHDGVLSLVSAGAGHAIVPESVATATRGAVAFSRLGGSPACLSVTAVWREDHDNPALRRFVSLLRDTQFAGDPTEQTAIGAQT